MFGLGTEKKKTMKKILPTEGVYLKVLRDLNY